MSTSKLHLKAIVNISTRFRPSSFAFHLLYLTLEPSEDLVLHFSGGIAGGCAVPVVGSSLEIKSSFDI